MIFKPLTAAILGLSLSPWVQAAPGSMDFTLDPIPLSSSAVPDPVGTNSVGRWLDNESRSASATTESRLEPRNVWDSNHLELENSPGLLQGAPFGHARAQVHELATQPTLSAEAWLDNGRAHVATDLTDVDQSQMASATIRWYRSFELQGHASLTFSGLLDMKDPTSVVPATSRFNTIGGSDSYGGGARLHSELGHSSMTLGLDMAYGANESDFSFSHGPDGRYALTITNPSDNLYSGTFSLELSSFQTSIPPVPEPASIASLLAGLAVVGAVARKQRRARA